MNAPGSRPSTRRSSLGRLVAAVALSLVVGGLSTAVVLAAAVYHAGTVDIEIDEVGGDRVSIAVPTTIVNAAVKLIPDRVYLEAAREAAPYWDAAQAAVREIADAPDAVLVSVDGPDLKVRVAKENGRLRIDVDEEGDRVHVSVPIETVVDIVEKIDL